MDICKNETIFKFLFEDTISSSSTSSSEAGINSGYLTLDSNSSSDDETEKPRIKRTRIENFVEMTATSYTNYEFKKHFRMSRSTVHFIVGLLESSNKIPSHKSGREKILCEKSFLLTLWYLSNKESYRQIADRFNVTESSVFRILTRVTDFLIEIAPQFIMWPTKDEAACNSQMFLKKRGFPDVLGAIDGTHIRIRRPEENEDSYVNRKGFHSIILQAVVDCKKRFVDVNCGEAGSQHDARVLRKSSLYRKAENCGASIFYDKYYLLGDSAYPSKMWLIAPFKDNGYLTDNQKTFNFRHSSTRMVVEHAFGLLKERFRRLHHFENLTTSLIVKCVIASCILHNICINKEDLVDYTPEKQDVDYSGNRIAEKDTESNRRLEVFNIMFS